ncbi:MAG: DUF368 domain-containing protein, partial [Proteobacteria bacterium]|nr:DUF368 domain-containing protein [Pseudomonadota bacterium]
MNKLIEAFQKSSGPRGLNESLLLILKSFFMGAANIIPGVSGGTIALITGIYEPLLNSLKSVNSNVVKSLLRFDFYSAIKATHTKFLFYLFLGSILSIISLARVTRYCLNYYPEFTCSLFLGLIIASVLLVGKDIKNWFGSAGISLLFFGVLAYIIVGLIPVNTPEALWFIFFAGVISISAMILPGLSGAFILLLLGKYSFIMGAVQKPFLLSNLIILSVFALGCLVGLAGFSRILSFLMDRYNNITLAALTGLMLGSLRKIWPFKEVIESKIINNKLYVISEINVFPEQLDTTFFVS